MGLNLVPKKIGLDKSCSNLYLISTWRDQWLGGSSFYHSSPSFSLAGTSITLGLSMILAVLLPFSTIPIIHDWYPSCFSISLQYAAACSLGRQISSPPDVSAEWPCSN